MMKKRALLALALLALPALLGAAPLPLPDTEAALKHRLEARFAGDRTGACVQAALIDKGQVLRTQVCAGTRKDPAPAQDAAFEIGSVSKTMTAYLVAGLIQRGQWSLDDPIARHLPGGTAVPRQGERQILVRDLVTHSSGLPALPPGMAMGDLSNPYASLSEAQLLASLAQVKLARPIGSQAEYSNYAMMLLSLAVARNLGGDYEAALREQLFKPLGMSTAYVSKPLGAAPAAGHLPTGEATTAWTIATNLAGVGMVKASLADMERYARAQLGDGPAAPVALMRQTQQPLAHGFAMNWMRPEVQGRQLVMHEGATGGFSSLVLLEPATQRGVVLLADTMLADLGGLGPLGLSLLGLDMPPQQARLPAEAPAALRQALAGEYELAGTSIKIWEEGGKLLAQSPGGKPSELRYDSRGDFYPLGLSALLRPQAPVEGRVERFAWHQMGGLLEARRVGLVDKPPSIKNPAWRDWAGEFQLVPQFAIRIFEKDGQLMLQGTGQPAFAAEVTGKDRIEIRSVGAVIEFERDAAGHVVAAVLKQGGQVLRGAKK
ncbi:beta-lactamase family protein [Pelomonas sp. V22]|uniref:serine hydrolase domain-containing protein n=1 Tax=Pelomonas sp. V22 TaxID=2822139 RepID=UPI0024A8C6AC|nr:serine hydrolase domain-containing protein [Pelomonas sp. V22]MDI4634640.1 beta-lactamase family protein [Pelomonas sp. V22]